MCFEPFGDLTISTMDGSNLTHKACAFGFLRQRRAQGWCSFPFVLVTENIFFEAELCRFAPPKRQSFSGWVFLVSQSLCQEAARAAEAAKNIYKKARVVCMCLVVLGLPIKTLESEFACNYQLEPCYRHLSKSHGQKFPLPIVYEAQDVFGQAHFANRNHICGASLHSNSSLRVISCSSEVESLAMVAQAHMFMVWDQGVQTKSLTKK